LNDELEPSSVFTLRLCVIKPAIYIER
jgi:hypothetical protein